MADSDYTPEVSDLQKRIRDQGLCGVLFTDGFGEEAMCILSAPCERHPPHLADSDYTPDEALAKAFHAEAKRHYDYGTDPWVWETLEVQAMYRKSARDFLATHRLVSLPSEPTAWAVEYHQTHGDSGRMWTEVSVRSTAERAARYAGSPSTGRIRPVYTIHGEPIDVTGADNA